MIRLLCFYSIYISLLQEKFSNHIYWFSSNSKQQISCCFIRIKIFRIREGNTHYWRTSVAKSNTRIYYRWFECNVVLNVSVCQCILPWLCFYFITIIDKCNYSCLETCLHFHENIFETFCCIFLKHNVYHHLILFKGKILFFGGYTIYIIANKSLSSAIILQVLTIGFWKNEGNFINLHHNEKYFFFFQFNNISIFKTTCFSMFIILFVLLCMSSL